ncbi:MAG: hypothetical protein RIS60_1488, partial [Pseudomonadota bacterium]
MAFLWQTAGCLAAGPHGNPGC